MNALKYLSLLAAVIFIMPVSAQVRRSIKGSVKDSTERKPLPGANIRILSEKDTLSATADDDGAFQISEIKSDKISIMIASIGFKSYLAEVTFDSKQSSLELKPVILNSDPMMLKEVEIKGDVPAVKIKRDTIEYNVDSYVIREGDYLEDLMKQLPGIEVDEDGNPTGMGKKLTKIRVNGKDFFTSDLKEFMKKLPPGIFSKVQLIDDYGDEANFTGIKLNAPTKIINLVSKPGKDKGKFGDLNGNGGTNNTAGLGVNGNIWQGQKQHSIRGNFNNTNNKAGYNYSSGAGINLRQDLKKDINGGIGYNYNRSRSKAEQFQTIETVNTLGTLFSENKDANQNSTERHGLSINLQSNKPGKYMRLDMSGGISNSNSDSDNSAIQSGVIRQNQLNNNGNSNSSPNLQFNFSKGFKIGKAKKVIFLNGSGNFDQTKGKQDIATQIQYFNQQTGGFLKDSLLRRLVSNRNNNSRISFNFSYSQPLSKPKDTIYRGLDFSYFFSGGNSISDLDTRVRNPNGEISYVDSLSNLYSSVSINQNMRVSYRRSSNRISYNFGFTLQPNLLSGDNHGRADNVKQNTLSVGPTASYNYNIGEGLSLNASYSGNSSPPSVYQLQSVADTRNLQNVVIGNPNLKTAFSHYINTDFNKFSAKSGRSINLNVNFSATQNQIIQNVRLIADTLNSLKQETRFENSNGQYNVSSYYSLSIPFAKRKYSVNLGGGLGFSNQVLYTDNIKNFNKGSNFSQSVTTRINTKLISLSGNAGYSFNNNAYSLATSRAIQIQAWSFGLNGNIRLKKSFSAGFNANKRFTKGYTIGKNDPFVVGLNVHQSLLKNNRLNLNLSVNDLFNQANNINQYVNQNTIIQTRNTQVTRFAILGISYNIQNFGK